MFTNLIQTLKEKFMPEPEKLSAVAKYKKHRVEMEKKFAPEYARPDPKEFKSPSGRYLLRITNYSQGKGFWDYSRGEVFEEVGIAHIAMTKPLATPNMHNTASTATTTAPTAPTT